MPSELDGLDEAAVRERVRRGEVNEVPRAAGRTVWQIIRTNVFTPFNALLGGLVVVILSIGAPQDALFGGVLVANTAIGIFQELRAKRTLDRLAVLTAPRARVVRAGSASEVSVGEVVLDDVLELRPGDQVVVDGTVLDADGLEVDESLLSGESEPVAKAKGAEVLSGSFAAAGSGRYRATRVGRAAYAASLAEQAKRFTLVRSELRVGINRIITLVSWALVPTATLLFVRAVTGSSNLGDAIRGAAAGTVGMVPEGLVLLTSVAFAVAVVRLARRRVLVQELPAVEGLARVDVLCTDKTGTLTEGRMAVEDLEVLAPEAGKAELLEALGEVAAADPVPNATMTAIRAAYPSHAKTWEVAASVPFSSARKWSGTSFKGGATWVLGAPDVMLATTTGGVGAERITAIVETRAETGRRVVLLARSATTLGGEGIPQDLEPMALVLLRDRVRDDAAATLRYFERQGVEVKVISGDGPTTVAAVAAEAGLHGSGRAIDARTLPEDAEGLASVVEEHAVFGRVAPHQKRAMIAALQANGHVVAMTGDGVNDVLALKDADIGVAMGSGSAASRATAQLVLLDSSFAALPTAVAEGRRVIANVERTGNLFLTKTVYAMLLALAVGVIGVPFPFLPRHLTLISTLTIGVPGFFLALAPSDRPARSGFIRRILRFAVPAGTLAAAGTFTAYALARGPFGTTLVVARSTATVVLFVMGLVILAAIASPLTALRGWLVTSMALIFVAILAIRPLRGFFALALPPMIVWLGGGVLAVAVAPFVWWLIVTSRKEQAPIGHPGLQAVLGLEGTSAQPAKGGNGLGRDARTLLASARSRLPALFRWSRGRLDPAEPRGLPLTLSVVAVALATWVFLGLTQDVLGHDDTVLADPRVEAIVLAHRAGWLTAMMKVITWLGSTAVLVPAVILLGGLFLLRRRDWRPLAKLALALGGAVGLYDIAQAAIGRARPPSAFWIGHYFGAAFPSGHATQAVAFYAMLAVILSTGTSYGRRALVWSGASLVTLVVGASRIYLGAHWLTDVLGGYALGAAWVALLLALALVAGSRAPDGTGEKTTRLSGISIAPSGTAR